MSDSTTGFDAAVIAVGAGADPQDEARIVCGQLTGGARPELLPTPLPRTSPADVRTAPR
ncbi:hypothetical protein [Cellulomonas bogoriensis]|uniref:hypothetical protein n=1 Tax=Cellulomonas bogoriensis TaxID=301388 RepID=UPI000AC60DCB|nr:hypothetical protein [Cellulomonas bogoriensis]